MLRKNVGSVSRKLAQAMKRHVREGERTAVDPLRREAVHLQIPETNAPFDVARSSANTLVISLKRNDSIGKWERIVPREPSFPSNYEFTRNANVVLKPRHTRDCRGILIRPIHDSAGEIRTRGTVDADESWIGYGKKQLNFPWKCDRKCSMNIWQIVQDVFKTVCRLRNRLAHVATKSRRDLSVCHQSDTLISQQCRTGDVCPSESVVWLKRNSLCHQKSLHGIHCRVIKA